jgi:hypothetical protein
MPSDTSTHLQIREYPILMWIIGAISIAISIAMVINRQPAWGSALFFLVGTLFAFFFGYVTTITGDKEAGTLTIRSQSIFRNVVKEYALNEIASVEVETNRDSDGNTYRVAIHLTGGESIPFHSYYTSGTAGKERQAKKVRDFLSLPEPKDASNGIVEALTQEFRLVQEGTTQEVAWRIEKGGFGTAEITRWVSTSTRMASGFLLILQKPRSSQLFSNSKLLNPISRLLYEQILKIYGFEEETTPGLHQASPLDPPEPRLDLHYATLTSDPYAARQILTPWFVIPLVQWAETHPIQQVQIGGEVGQLVVLFSPQGVKLARMGETEPGLTDEFIHLGVELVKTHGG